MNEPAPGARNTSTRGIFTDFGGYLTPRTEDYQAVFREGVVVLDTNVLLDLYRYGSGIRSDLFAALTEVQSNLWVPHQVMHEFWDNRESVLRNPRDTPKAIAALEEQLAKSLHTLNEWTKRLSLPTEEAESLRSKITQSYSTLVARVQSIDDEEKHDFQEGRTQDDPVLAVLSPLLENRVGPPLEPTEYEKALKEAARRKEAMIPPGYKDRNKPGEHPYGDFLVWEQTLVAAQGNPKDILFVTGDDKEDWWRFEGHQRRGPRVELARELQLRVGTRLFMMTPSTFLKHARDLLGVSIRQESVDVISHVDRYESRRWEKDAVVLRDLTAKEFNGLMLTLWSRVTGGSLVPLNRVPVSPKHWPPDLVFEDEQGKLTLVTWSLTREAKAQLVGSRYVAEYVGTQAALNADTAILVSTKRFSPGAKSLAGSRRNLHLVDIDSLTNLLSVHLNLVAVWDQGPDDILY